MGLLLKVLAVAVVLVLLGCAIAWPNPKQIPIQPGTTEGYWNTAAGIQAKDTIPGGGWYFAQPIDGWFLYTADHMHGSQAYRVPAPEVLADFPKDLAELRRDDKVVLKWAEAGFRAWEKVDPQRAKPLVLLLHLREAQLDWWIKNRPDGLLLGMQEDFDLGVAWQRMGQFPLIQMAEWSYLSAVIVFAAWPWIRNRGRSSWAIHTALLPLLLLLPYYLGYCAWNYTSAGPGGGVVYPVILDAFQALPWTATDRSIVKCCPQVLASLTGPLGPMLSLSGGRSAGPVTVLFFGMGLGGLVFGTATLFARLRQPPSNHPTDVVR